MNNNFTLSFIFPVLNGTMGGAQMLFINIISYLADNKACHIRLYDYKQGLIRTQLQIRNISNYEFISLDESEFYIPNKGYEIFILSNAGFLLYPQLMKIMDNTTILVWDVFYPFWSNFTQILRGVSLPGLKNKVLNILYEKKGIVFMENEGLRKFEQFGYVFNDNRTVSIPVTDVESIHKCSLNTGLIHIGYIGRSAYWKITPVIYLLNNLGKSDKKYQLTIVTDNIKLFSSYLTIPENVSITFKEDLYGDDLKSLILTMDIGFSMGTAALEFSKYGIPTILVDSSNKLFPENYKFRWIFENIPGNLGYDLSSSRKDYNNSGKKWDDIINQYLTESELIGDRCFEYTLINHSIDKVADNLLTFATQSKLYPKDLNGFLLKIFHFFYKLRRRLKMFRLLEMY